MHKSNYTVALKSCLPCFFERDIFGVPINPFSQGLILSLEYSGGSNSCVGKKGSGWLILGHLYSCTACKYDSDNTFIPS